MRAGRAHLRAAIRRSWAVVAGVLCLAVAAGWGVRWHGAQREARAWRETLLQAQEAAREARGSDGRGRTAPVVSSGGQSADASAPGGGGEKAAAVAGWLVTLSPEQVSALASGRRLPIEFFTPRQRELLTTVAYHRWGGGLGGGSLSGTEVFGPVWYDGAVNLRMRQAEWPKPRYVDKVLVRFRVELPGGMPRR